tara:strand:- start:5681 stop:6778 length:1098 start_codon:yes stop_codon:yes gene_type:complete
MAVVLNAKGTSVPYFKIGKTGVTLYQGGNDPHSALGYAVQTNDIWLDTNDKTLKFRTSSNTWDPIADNMGDLTDVDLTGLADGYFLRYNSTTSNWEPHEVAGGLASDWGSIADSALSYDGYTGDVWSVTTATNTANFTGNVAITDNLTVSGNATISGNLTFGNADTDTVALSAEIVSNIIPDADATYDLGSSSKTWNELHAKAITLSSTDSGSSAGPVIDLKRDITGADANYIGQVKFSADNDADQNTVFAKITGKILDAADGSEDGIIEFAHKKGGSNVITGRWRSDSLQLLNDTSLTVSGTIDNSDNTGAMSFPVGTTAQRPGSASAGMVRFNSETSRFEGYNGSEWINIDIPDDWGGVDETP